MDEARDEAKEAIEEEKQQLDKEYEAYFLLLQRMKNLRSPPKGKQAELRQKVDALLDWAMIFIERELSEIIMESQDVLDDRLDIEDEEFYEGDDDDDENPGGDEEREP
jgi:hypothetical protein